MFYLTVALVLPSYKRMVHVIMVLRMIRTIGTKYLELNELLFINRHFFTAVLYAFFGLRLLYIAWRSDSKASSKKEMEEVVIHTKLRLLLDYTKTILSSFLAQMLNLCFQLSFHGADAKA